MNVYLRKSLAIALSILILNCCTYRDLAGLGARPEPLNWVKDKKSSTHSYKEFNECKSGIGALINKDEKEKAIADCMYSRGYRFKPEIGWCRREHLKDRYICRNKDKYSR